MLTLDSILSGLMFSCLDTSIVSTALVSLSKEFENYEDAPWVILGYLLTYMSGWTLPVTLVLDPKANGKQASPSASPS